MFFLQKSKKNQKDWKSVTNLFFFAKKSKRLKISYKFAFILPFPPRNSSIRPQAATASYSTAKQPLGFHNFSRTPNPRFCGRIDEFLVAVAAFLGSPNPYPSPPSPPPNCSSNKKSILLLIYNLFDFCQKTRYYTVFLSRSIIPFWGGGKILNYPKT